MGMLDTHYEWGFWIHMLLTGMSDLFLEKELCFFQTYSPICEAMSLFLDWQTEAGRKKD